MPLLNVTRVINSPFFSDSFTLITRTESVGTNGRVSMTEAAPIPAVGTVLPLDPKKMVRRDDGSYAERGIEVWAPMHVNPVPPTDAVIYLGERYIVTSQDNYTRFGQGFTHITAEVQASRVTRL